MLTDGLEWCGLLWCVYQTLILTAPIHCRASIAETLMQRHISTNLMKKQTHLYLRWSWGWVNSYSFKSMAAHRKSYEIWHIFSMNLWLWFQTFWSSSASHDTFSTKTWSKNKFYVLCTHILKTYFYCCFFGSSQNAFGLITSIIFCILSSSPLTSNVLHVSIRSCRSLDDI